MSSVVYSRGTFTPVVCLLVWMNFQPTLQMPPIGFNYHGDRNFQSPAQLILVQNSDMQTIALPTVTIRHDGIRVEVTHNQSGMTTETTARQLDRWGVAQLRKVLVPQMQNSAASVKEFPATGLHGTEGAA